jgi:DNA-binding CsgD family transcriptional regulator
MWYRVATLFYVGALIVTDLVSTNIPFYIILLTYNILLLLYKNDVIESIKRRPLLILIDLVIIAVVEYIGGPYGNPYLLYTFSPLFVGGFLFGYRGSFILVSFRSILYICVDSFAGFGFLKPVDHGEYITTPIIEMFIITFIMAFLAELLEELEISQHNKAMLNTEFENTIESLKTSLSTSKLSKREKQVLELASEGKTIIEISTELAISKNTVKTYLRRAYLKLDSRSKQQVVSEALR